MKPVVTWVILASTRNARVFENRGPTKGLHRVADKVWQAPPAAEFSSEPGMGHSRMGPGRFSVDQGNPQEEADIRFAKSVVKSLETAQADKAFDRLVVAAGPHMLGLMRKAMNDRLRASVVAEFAKDLTEVSSDDLEQHIGTAIAL